MGPTGRREPWGPLVLGSGGMLACLPGARAMSTDTGLEPSEAPKATSWGPREGSQSIM